MAAREREGMPMGVGLHQGVGEGAKEKRGSSRQMQEQEENMQVILGSKAAQLAIKLRSGGGGLLYRST